MKEHQVCEARELVGYCPNVYRNLTVCIIGIISLQ
jgi:hypothetical protein